MQVCRDIVHRIEQVFTETIETWIDQVDRVCEDLPWPLDWFCHTVTHAVKWVVTVVKTIVTTWVEVVCTPIAIAINLLAEAVQLILSIPIIGALIKWWVGAVVYIWSQLVGLIDMVGGLIGIRPIKHLRLHVVILMRDDRTLTVPASRISLALQRAEAIFRERADVKIHTYVHQVDTPSPRNALYVESSAGLLGEDMTGAGFYFQTTITEMLWEDNTWFALRIGAPIVAFVVDGVGGTAIGCSAGPLMDYICVEGGQMLVPPQGAGATGPVVAPMPAEPAGATYALASATLAHEIGHACGLLHDNVTDCKNGDPTNLMYCSPRTPAGVARGDNLSPFQRGIVRSSPHVTYV